MKGPAGEKLGNGSKEGGFFRLWLKYFLKAFPDSSTESIELSLVMLSSAIFAPKLRFVLFFNQNSNLWYPIWHSIAIEWHHFYILLDEKSGQTNPTRKMTKNVLDETESVGWKVWSRSNFHPTHFCFIQHIFFFFFKFWFRSNVSNISSNTENYRCWMKCWTRLT